VTRPFRFIVALLLATIYFMIVVVPQAPLALKSPGLPHAIAQECSGDCDVCGCSREQRANHTCCCWRKKLSALHEHETADYCKTKQKSTRTILSCGCPCDGSQHVYILAKIFNDGLLMGHFYQSNLVFAERRYSGSLFQRFSARSIDPPEPPPKRVLCCDRARYC